MELTIKAFETEQITRVTGQNAEQKEEKQEKKSVYGGNLNLANDPVAQRRQEAQERAWSIVKNAWDNDKSVDDMIQARRNHWAEMEALKKAASEELAEINDEKEVLRELYDVGKDSKEQKELELLQKEQNIKSGVSKEKLTKEEIYSLSKLHEEPLTEYQSRGLDLNKRAIEQKKQMIDADRRMRDDTADIYSIQQERLKSNPMLDAKKAAEEILKDANETIVGMLVQESQDYIDEKMEETSEKVKKSMEKKEEREEQLEELQLKRAVQEAIIKGTKEAAEKAKAVARAKEAPDVDISEMMDIAHGDSVTKDVGESLDEIKSSMNLLEADLKGIKVDEEI